ncbi:radial spoke head 14 homolog [Lingula anatina]|uniref:Radial spoke head 14 homolog n=1 Tax=Lingula anatina TaxID=7574 RepID=A0A1S3HML5_LINAN|nr:radial spoke head 14 homolog [Lingula anatina]XP_013406254.1 radial spoke head 14 homolog [Lingula anatina]|eukprot:XP_013387310.1 radial spoke head 14 homolog [Lingula anatina]
MAETVISAKMPPHIDVTRAPLAYGDRALPRLNRELIDLNLLTRQRAVRSLCDYLHDPEHIAEALRQGIPESLKGLLDDKDVTVRQKATECLYIIAGYAVGREAFLDQNIIIPLSKLFADKEDIVRKNAHKAMEMVSETMTGAEGIVEANLVPVLVEKLKTEHDEIKELILDTLHFCMRVDTAHALRAEAMQVFTNHLQHGTPVIRAKAARDIMDLSVPLDGKNKAVEVGSVASLVELLKDSDADVRASAAGAIMTITITTKGKYTALNCNAIEPLVKLVDDENSEVRANALKAITCLAEAPEGRQELLNHIDQIRKRTNDAIPAVVKHANIAVKVITWKP